MKTQQLQNDSGEGLSRSPNITNGQATTYRFNRQWIKNFGSESEAFDHALSYDDNVQAIVERQINGVWQTFTETNDGNGAWI